MYTTIIHPLRKALCLSINEYVLLDSIYHLSHNDRYGGWCIMTKKKLSDVLDINDDTIYRILNTLESKELIIRDPVTKYIKTADSFNEMIANKHDWMIGFKGKESALLSGKFNLDPQNPSATRKIRERDPQNPRRETRKIRDNIYIDNKTNNTSAKEIFIEDQLIDRMKQKFRGNIIVEKDRFENYWNEENEKTGKLRWQLEKTFEASRRFISWLDRSNNTNRIGSETDDELVAEAKKINNACAFAKKYGDKTASRILTKLNLG